jgi:hypothetical protein
LRLGHLADLLAARANHNINQLVFFQLHHRHWTVFHHTFNRLDSGMSEVRWFNSLAPSSAPLQDIQTQLVVQQYLTHLRNENSVRVIPLPRFWFIESVVPLSLRRYPVKIMRPFT